MLFICISSVLSSVAHTLASIVSKIAPLFLDYVRIESQKLRCLVAPPFLMESTATIERTENGSELMAPDLRCLHLNEKMAANLVMLKLQQRRQIELYRL